MQKFPSYVITNDTVVVTVDGKSYSARKGAPNYLPLRRALDDEDLAGVLSNLTVRKTVRDWAKGRFSVDDAGTKVLMDGYELPQGLNERILATIAEGHSPEAFLNFWERLQKNPSWNSVQQLFRFLDRAGIPLEKEGTFLAYKGVRADFKDKYTGKFDNRPGCRNSMPRNHVSDDPTKDCSFGFHVGSESYAKGYAGVGGKMVICRVAPEDVVSVPHDCDSQKVRVCDYTVVGHYGDKLSDTVDVVSSDDVAGSYEELASLMVNNGDTNLDDPDQLAILMGMQPDQLTEQPIEVLRKFAGQLGIVGASKIRGGKHALVARIVEVRDDEYVRGPLPPTEK